MQLEKKALYNSLRLSWLQDATLSVEPWQVEDYRRLDFVELISRLGNLGISLDRQGFLEYADNFDTPEEMSHFFAEDCEPLVYDQFYLLIFELWRRLLPQKQSLSIFCDELDYQIYLYDEGRVQDEIIQDMLAYLEEILQENADEGEEPPEVFHWVTLCCAHDMESFLYDFIASQIDGENYSYAAELLDSFYDFVDDAVWLDFLRARIAAATDVGEANEMIEELVAETEDRPDLQLYLEILNFLSRHGDQEYFASLVRVTSVILEREEDFRELLELSKEFYLFHNKLSHVEELEAIVSARKSLAAEASFDKSDPDLQRLLKLVEASLHKETL